jgi:hypothetical protein
MSILASPGRMPIFHHAARRRPLELKKVNFFKENQLHLGFKYAADYDDYRNKAVLFLCHLGFAGFCAGNPIDSVRLPC